MLFDFSIDFRFFRRVTLYLLGFFVLALGVVLAVKSNLGTTPVNSIAYVLSVVYNADLGLMTTLVYTVLVLIQIVMLRKEFPPIYFLQIGAAAIFGGFVFLINRVLTFSIPDIYALRLLLLFISIPVISLGVFLYLKADLIPQPVEGLLLAIRKKRHWKLHNIKTCIDSSYVVIAALISLIVLHKIVGIREGTVIAMLTIGKIMGFFSEKFGAKVQALFRL